MFIYCFTSVVRRTHVFRHDRNPMYFTVIEYANRRLSDSTSARRWAAAADAPSALAQWTRGAARSGLRVAMQNAGSPGSKSERLPAFCMATRIQRMAGPCWHVAHGWIRIQHVSSIGSAYVSSRATHAWSYNLAVAETPPAPAVALASC